MVPPPPHLLIHAPADLIKLIIGTPLILVEGIFFSYGRRFNLQQYVKYNNNIYTDYGGTYGPERDPRTHRARLPVVVVFHSIFIIVVIIAVFRPSSGFNLFFIFVSSRRDNARSSSRFIHYYYYYHRCIYAFFAFTEGDKSTETSMCKCCDIKNDNGKRLLL